MKYVYRNGKFIDKDGNEMEIPERDGPCVPHIWSDLPGYMSVVTNRWVEGRRARRYDLEASGCRPCEPEEGPKTVRSKALAKKLGLEWDPNAGRPKHWSKDWSGKRIET